MPTKYQEFFLTLFVKPTDFWLVFNFEQTHTVTTFGEQGIMAHITMIAIKANQSSRIALSNDSIFHN